MKAWVKLLGGLVFTSQAFGSSGFYLSVVACRFFFASSRRKEKAIKKKRRLGVSPSAEGEEASAASTAQAFEKA